MARPKAEACPQCTQARDGLGHDVECWAAFQLELLVRRPDIAQLVASPTNDGYEVAFAFADEIRGIFDAWTERLRSGSRRDIATRDTIVATRLARALTFVDRQLAASRAAAEQRPQLRLVHSAHAA
ncbi:MAG: hypothetical protein Q7T01_03260 [bacterium]|nr:hypothetical protein [bacterium]